LLEEETFTHDMGRKITEKVRLATRLVPLIELGEYLAECANPDSPVFDPDCFLPVSRFPDEDLDAKGKRNLWVAETFAYFGVPDSARESAEDFGLVAVQYGVSDTERAEFRRWAPLF
jgi:hypothetical protein